MVQLNSCCQVVKMVSAGEDGLMGGGGGGGGGGLTYNCIVQYFTHFPMMYSKLGH
jgi:hypothetical protein